MDDLLPCGVSLPAALRPSSPAAIRAGLPGRVTVFEVVNRKRRERYITCTSLPMFMAIAEFTAAIPSKVGHWRGDRRLQFHSLEFDLTPGQACEVVARQARRCSAEGWTCRKDLSGGLRSRT